MGYKKLLLIFVLIFYLFMQLASQYCPRCSLERCSTDHVRRNAQDANGSKYRCLTIKENRQKRVGPTVERFGVCPRFFAIKRARFPLERLAAESIEKGAQVADDPDLVALLRKRIDASFN